jgi:cytochrome c oxidase cbb3-type subunit III
MRRKLLTSVKRFRARKGSEQAKHRSRSVRLWIALLLAVSAAMPRYVAAEQGSATQAGEASSANALGQRTFRAQCAACHGLDGRGGEHAPSILQDQVKSLSDEDLAGMVHNGIPGKGMPEFSLLGSAAVKSVVAYLRELQGPIAPEAVTGNATLGRTLFFGKAECSACHVMEGTGNFIAGDLSDYGRNHQPSEIRSAILGTRKAADSPPEQLTVKTRSGAELSGVLRNEDNFSFQLQDPQGDFYLILKSDVVRVRREPVRVMPSDYSKRFTSQEIDDLVSFIARRSPE